MLLASVPKIVSLALPSFVWNIPTQEKTVFLTFDDGPIPETTPWVLSVLRDFNAKACFFCVGENVQKYNDLYQQIIDEGHSVGNHTFNHLVGWKTPVETYIENIHKAKSYIDSTLFRPPHGLIRNSQFNLIKDKYKVIMWNVLSMDYDKTISPEQCYRNVIDHVKQGSIVVFHDSIKAWENLRFALPKTLEYLSNEGYSFSAIKASQFERSKQGSFENRKSFSILKKRA